MTKELGICGLYYVEIYSFYIQFVERFYYEWMLNFVRCFFCVYEIIMIFKFFILLI